MRTVIVCLIRSIIQLIWIVALKKKKKLHRIHTPKGRIKGEGGWMPIATSSSHEWKMDRCVFFFFKYFPLKSAGGTLILAYINYRTTHTRRNTRGILYAFPNNKKRKKRTHYNTKETDRRGGAILSSARIWNLIVIKSQLKWQSRRSEIVSCWCAARLHRSSCQKGS